MTNNDSKTAQTSRPRSLRRRLIALGSIAALGLAVVLGQGLTGRATGDSAEGGGCGGSESEMISHLTQGKGLSGNAEAVSQQLNISVEEVLKKRQDAEEELARFKATGASPDSLPEVDKARLLELQQTLGILTVPHPDADPAVDPLPTQKAGLVKPTAVELEADKTKRETFEARLRETPVEGEEYDALKQKVFAGQ